MALVFVIESWWPVQPREGQSMQACSGASGAIAELVLDDQRANRSFVPCHHTIHYHSPQPSRPIISIGAIDRHSTPNDFALYARALAGR